MIDNVTRGVLLSFIATSFAVVVTVHIRHVVLVQRWYRRQVRLNAELKNGQKAVVPFSASGEKSMTRTNSRNLLPIR